MKIPIFTDDPGWHGAQLMQAFSQRGHEAIFVSLQACILNLSHLSAQVNMPHFMEMPAAAFVRGVSGGTLQQVITRLNVMHVLTMQGARIYNAASAIERTVDKGMTSFLLKKHAIPSPATWVCESRVHAESIIQSAALHQQTLVLKPLFGSQGLGVRKIQVNDSVPVPMEQYVDGIYYLQELIETPDAPHDYRVFVINHKVVAAMKRIGNTWVNNVAAGGRCERVIPTAEMISLATRSAIALNIDYCGVDIIQAKDGAYYVLEVNSIPAWKGLQSVTNTNIAQLLVDDFLSKLS